VQCKNVRYVVISRCTCVHTDQLQQVFSLTPGAGCAYLALFPCTQKCFTETSVSKWSLTGGEASPGDSVYTGSVLPVPVGHTSKVAHLNSMEEQPPRVAWSLGEIPCAVVAACGPAGTNL